MNRSSYMALEPDLSVVFDYQCDVEVHLPDSYEFCQVKTSSGTQEFGVGRLYWPGKNGSLSMASGSGNA